MGNLSSRALETPTHGINTCIPQLGVLQLSLRDSNCITKQAVGCHSRRAPRVPRGMLIWPGSSGIQSLVPQPRNVKNVKNVKTHVYFVDAARKSQMSNMSNVKTSKMSNMSKMSSMSHMSNVKHVKSQTCQTCQTITQITNTSNM